MTIDFSLIDWKSLDEIRREGFAFYIKGGSIASRAHWDKIRTELPRFKYDPPREVMVAVPVHLAQEVRRFISEKSSGAMKLMKTETSP